MASYAGALEFASASHTSQAHSMLQLHCKSRVAAHGLTCHYSPSC